MGDLTPGEIRSFLIRLVTEMRDGLLERPPPGPDDYGEALLALSGLLQYLQRLPDGDIRLRRLARRAASTGELMSVVERIPQDTLERLAAASASGHPNYALFLDHLVAAA